jgi:hypothetical protein
MGQLERLVEECIVTEDHKATWLACIPKFRNGMIKLGSRDDFDNQCYLFIPEGHGRVLSAVG